MWLALLAVHLHLLLAFALRPPHSLSRYSSSSSSMHHCSFQHVAFIVDGNGRWGLENNMTRMDGHSRGAANTVEVVKKGFQLGVPTISLYLFSTENWQRPRAEVENIFELLERYLLELGSYLVANKVRVEVVGQLSRFPLSLQELLSTSGYNGGDNESGAKRLVLCLSYGGRDDIVGAARLLAAKVARGELAAGDISEGVFSSHLSTGLRNLPDPDVVIRTSGAFRISNFMLYQTAYSEFVKVDCLWPDFSPEMVEGVLASSGSRTRTYGGL